MKFLDPNRPKLYLRAATFKVSMYYLTLLDLKLLLHFRRACSLNLSSEAEVLLPRMKDIEGRISVQSLML